MTNVEIAVHLSRRSAIYLEHVGMKNSRGSVTRRVAAAHGFKGSRMEILQQYEDWLEERMPHSFLHRYTERRK